MRFSHTCDSRDAKWCGGCGPVELAVDTGVVSDAGGGSFQHCRIYANKLNGMLVRDGADPVLLGNEIRQNGANGILLQVQRGRAWWPVVPSVS
jgi:hypothetical protein